MLLFGGSLTMEEQLTAILGGLAGGKNSGGPGALQRVDRPVWPDGDGGGRGLARPGRHPHGAGAADGFAGAFAGGLVWRLEPGRAGAAYLTMAAAGLAPRVEAVLETEGGWQRLFPAFS